MDVVLQSPPETVASTPTDGRREGAQVRLAVAASAGLVAAIGMRLAASAHTQAAADARTAIDAGPGGRADWADANTRGDRAAVTFYGLGAVTAVALAWAGYEGLMLAMQSPGAGSSRGFGLAAAPTVGWSSAW